MKRWIWIPTVFLMILAVSAQDATCPMLQRQALANVSEQCAEQLANTLCYGHPTVSVVYTDLADDSRLSDVGNTIPLTNIDWFSTSNEANTWGTARAFLQVFGENSLIAKPATLVAFGNTVIFNQGTEGMTVFTVDVEVSVTQGANVRALPTIEGRLIEPVLLGTKLMATGLSDDDQWVQVVSSNGEMGWVNITAITGDLASLDVVDDVENSVELTLPLQSLSLQTGVSDAECDGVPPSGVLIQSATDDNPSVWYINGTTLALNGTAFIQAQPETGMLVHVLDGVGSVTALNETQEIEAGYVSRVFVELDDEGYLDPIEPPALPLVYDYDSLYTLPVELLTVSTRVGFDIYTIITPRPAGGESPIAGMALDAPCKFTTGQSGANIRSRPSQDAPILAVLGFRESAEPIGRAIGLDGLPWWKLAEGVWIRTDTTVTGGDCASVPRVEFDG